MNVLLVYPRYPDTFWSFRHALRFVGKKAGFPPLGLLTVASLLPADWRPRLIDLNVRPLTDQDICQADLVFVSAMTVQRESAREVLARCRSLGVRTVAGGPLFTSCHADFPDVDHLVLGEAELTLPPFLADLQRGTPGRVYTAGRWTDLRETPPPRWDLIDLRDYAALSIQYSRGCPFDCEFCDITQLFGRVPRTKSREQLTAELDALFRRGWRGGVFFVDDNFIGDKPKLKGEILPAMIDWMERRGHPFSFQTEASINLADDGELMAQMARAGFEEVFIGIETPQDAGLNEAGKVQNKNRDLLASVQRIQHAGLQVQGGFIVGFDSDPPGIFEKQIRFIQESGIVTAMVGILMALRGTKLHRRLEEEGRLLCTASGNNTAVSLNFIPRMNPDTLVSGYRSILTTIYSPAPYYRRLRTFLREYRPVRRGKFRLTPSRLRAFFASIVMLGVIGRERLHFWRLFCWSLFRPRIFPLAITLAIYGFHFRKITEQISCSGMFEEGRCPD
ncbi:MAG TPA: B12-binding domain-containing radical SAM protein [Geobacteraceae bacterium]|nr:B12-binding domain-containing radical SAM protein [Geobacteraceae bacterium]